MEVMVRNLPVQMNEKQLNKFFRPIFNNLGVKTYSCQKTTGNRWAMITILDTGKARLFLQIHGQTQQGREGFATVQQKLYHLGQPVNCIPSNKAPDPYHLRCLKKEESDRYAAAQSEKPLIVPARLEGPSQPQTPRAFDTTSISCGQWTYVGDDLAFVTYLQESRKGRLIFGSRGLFVKLTSYNATAPVQQIEISYNSVQSFTVGPKSKPSITFSLAEAPKFFEKLPRDDLLVALKKLTLKRQSQALTRKRITAISRAHEVIVASCLCYRFLLSRSSDIEAIYDLKSFAEIPKPISWETSAIMGLSFAAQMTTLNTALTGTKSANMPFELKFQMQKLAQNGFLSPSKVVDLLAVVSRHLSLKDSATVTESVKGLCGQIPFAGPDSEAADFSLDTLRGWLEENQKSITRGYTYSRELSEQYDHIAAIHKATVTPAGIYLYGPDPEVKNRVLRKYSAFQNYFLSVSFLDEDGEQIRFERQTSRVEIFHGRFKKVLEGVINIAGRGYEVCLLNHSYPGSKNSH